MVRDSSADRIAVPDSPRIRGDGPRTQCVHLSAELFSPYSRGWSQRRHGCSSAPRILPVFAGMVPQFHSMRRGRCYSPRIRGDGPEPDGYIDAEILFSPYSRGWSAATATLFGSDAILPVFAGMVLRNVHPHTIGAHSPRIRGDGPANSPYENSIVEFSPYSRGWSLVTDYRIGNADILPVFAGMVPHPTAR